MNLGNVCWFVYAVLVGLCAAEGPAKWIWGDKVNIRAPNGDGPYYLFPVGESSKIVVKKSPVVANQVMEMLPEFSKFVYPKDKSTSRITVLPPDDPNDLTLLHGSVLVSKKRSRPIPRPLYGITSTTDIPINPQDAVIVSNFVNSNSAYLLNNLGYTGGSMGDTTYPLKGPQDASITQELLGANMEEDSSSLHNMFIYAGSTKSPIGHQQDTFLQSSKRPETYTATYSNIPSTNPADVQQNLITYPGITNPPTPHHQNQFLQPSTYPTTHSSHNIVFPTNPTENTPTDYKSTYRPFLSIEPQYSTTEVPTTQPPAEDEFFQFPTAANLEDTNSAVSEDGTISSYSPSGSSFILSDVTTPNNTSDDPPLNVQPLFAGDGGAAGNSFLPFDFSPSAAASSVAPSTASSGLSLPSIGNLLSTGNRNVFSSGTVLQFVIQIIIPVVIFGAIFALIAAVSTNGRRRRDLRSDADNFLQLPDAFPLELLGR